MLCLPKALVKDTRQNDSITKPYALSTAWGRTGASPLEACMPGYKVLVTPNSPEAIAVARKTVLNMACDIARSSYPDAQHYNTMGAHPLDTQLACNFEAMNFNDPTLVAALTEGPTGASSGLTTLSQMTKDSTTTMNTLCADTCLQVNPKP